jgi:hypothetical protein
MPYEHLPNGESQEKDRAHRLFAPKPEIKILLYTDDPRVITPGLDTSNLGTMIDHLHAHSPTFARLCVTWLSRNSSDANNKLNPEMLKDYDQIWFFGVHPTNGKNPTLGVLGGPESELDANEVKALEDWMKINEKKELKGGGVLITGDHAISLPDNAKASRTKLSLNKSHEKKFFGLGRALGRCVPRAGLLRKWDGKPTNCKKDSFNTQTPVPGIDPDGPQLQVDENPLQLLLETFDEKGNAHPRGLPHPLFLYKIGKWIQVFPDHMHEGALVIPKKFDLKVWPKGKFVHPKPQVVARGVDHRNWNLLDILAAYNGECAGVGRIVSDSTWHHYLNENLDLFGSPAPPGSVADQIGQFYGNLAVWLSPRSKRREMAYAMFSSLSTHLFTIEELRLEKDDCPESEVDQVLSIGRAAYSILSRLVSPCEIHELLQAVVPDEYCGKYETLYFPDRGFSLSPFPSKELILGCVADLYQQEVISMEFGGRQGAQLAPLNVINSGFRKAVDIHIKQIGQAALSAKMAFKT